jgi:FkbM family methyltransferase
MNTKILNWENRLRQMLSGDRGSVSIINQYLNPDYTFIDIGCNTGLLTKMILELNPNYKSIHMFEPITEYYIEVVNKFNQYDRIKINNIGLSDKNEIVHIKMDSQNLGYNKIGNRGDTQIHLITFDEYAEVYNIGDIDFIKIDTEGYDIKVMRGMHNWLVKRNKLPFIFFEKGWDIKLEIEHCNYMIRTYGYKKYIEYDTDIILIP